MEIVGRVHYPIKNQAGCRPFREDDFDSDHLKEASVDGHRIIIMVDRGTCHFVLKATNIQKFGGILAIIVDSKIENPKSLVMADDGTGSSVKIPSFLIRHADGKLLKDAIHKLARNDSKNWHANQTNVDKNSSRYSRGWKYHGSRVGYKNKGHQVMLRAKVDFGRDSKSTEVVNVDVWYSNIYELF